MPVFGCTDATTGPGHLNYTTVVAGEVNDLFLPTFDTLAARGARLATDLAALGATPTDSGLRQAQADWRAARATYEFNEAFGYGPIATDGVDPAVDTWPVDITGINTLIAGSDAFTASYISALPTTLKGFHAVEYILFGDTGGATAASLSPRDLEYLTAAGQDLATELAVVKTAWSADGGNYAGQVLTAGHSGSVYATSGAALQDIVAQMVGQPGQVVYKLVQPLTTDSSIYEESRFSDNTLGDIENNIAGTAALYYGAAAAYGGDTTVRGRGLGALVAAKDATLDATVRSQLAAAAAAIAAITPSFDVALHADPSALAHAEQAVLSLQKTMVNLVAPLLGDGSPGALGPQGDND